MTIRVTLGQLNVVLAYENLNPRLIPTSDIKSRISVVYGIDTQIVLTEFPDLMALLIPQQQISIIGENNRLQIINAGTGDITGRRLEEFSKLVVAIKEVVQQRQTDSIFKAYGINYNLLFELEDCRYNAGELLKRKFIRTLTPLETSFGGTLESASPGVVVTTPSERFDLRFEPILQQNLVPSNKISSLCNIHIPTTVLPEYSELQRQLSENYTRTITNIQQFLTVR